MEMRAYPEIYLNRAMATMGDMFDYAINDCQIPGGEFVKMFVSSNVCKRMENGEINYLAGKSGVEIVVECIYETSGKAIMTEPQERYNRSAEYWCGWAVCYYQWRSKRKYAEIFGAVSYEELLSLYPTLHETSEEKLFEVLDEKIRAVYSETNLKRIRTAYGCSQRELAEGSGVNLRSIQMYEQRNKDINKAQTDTVYCLAKALGCAIEDLLEN